MPMPMPRDGEKSSEFMSRCMSDSMMNSEYPDEKQRSAICNSQMKKEHKKESITCLHSSIEKKETDAEFIIGGYVATDHLDSGFYDEDRGLWVRDQIPKETLSRWAEDINAGNPRANKVSVNHNRETHVAGVAIKGSAKVERLSDGHHALYVDTLVDRTKDDFSKTKERLDNGTLDSFSIEFTTFDPMTGDTIQGSVFEREQDQGIIRTLLADTPFLGYTLASRPMNEHAVRTKEIPTQQNIIQKQKEVTQMTETIETKEPVVALSEKERQDYLAMKKERDEKLRAEQKAAEEKEIKGRIMEELKKEFSAKDVKEDIKPTPSNVECKELKMFEDAIKSDSKVSIAQQFKIAGKLADMAGLTVGGLRAGRAVETKMGDYDGKFTVKTDNGRSWIEYKGLGITTNQNTDTDYLLSAAELSDVFDPVIYNALNQATTTFNILEKEDFSNKGNNQVQFSLKTAANTTAGSYTGNAVSLGNVTREKFQTKFKKYAVGIEIDGDMIAAARGGPMGDVFAQEVMDSTDDLMAQMNLELFAEVGLETAAGVIGFEYISDSAGNTSLYNTTRTAANKLAPDAASDTYINGSSQDITLNNLRLAIEKAVIDGAPRDRLVFITHPTQVRKFKGVYQASEKHPAPTSSKFGFEGMMSFDGVPIFEDKDCTSDNWHLIPLDSTKIAIWVPPTLELLGKDSDSQKAFIKTYLATFYQRPRSVIMIYDNATT